MTIVQRTLKRTNRPVDTECALFIDTVCRLYRTFLSELLVKKHADNSARAPHAAAITVDT